MNVQDLIDTAKTPAYGKLLICTNLGRDSAISFCAMMEDLRIDLAGYPGL
jgi:hypothetical protein